MKLQQNDKELIIMKNIYIILFIFISIFIWSCSENSNSSPVGDWVAESYQPDFAVTIIDSTGSWGGTPMEEIELTCASDILQSSEDMCEEFDWCVWVDEQGCSNTPGINFSEEGGEIILSLNSDSQVIWNETHIDPFCASFTDEQECNEAIDSDYEDSLCHWMSGICMNMDEDTACSSNALWQELDGDIIFTAIGGDCDALGDLTVNPIPFIVTDNQMTWSVPMIGDFYFGFDLNYTNNSIISVIWSRR